MYIELIRLNSDPNIGTKGVLKIDGIPMFVTLEPYARNNKRNISCINEGSYSCKKYDSKRFPNTFEITNVEGRSHILFHKGNVLGDTSGCILIGSSFNKTGITYSANAFNEFRDITRNTKELTLVIISNY